MNEQDQAPRRSATRHALARREFLATTATIGAGLALTGALRAPSSHLATAWASSPALAPAACQESVEDLLNTTLTAEHLTVTCYYTALVTPTLLQQIAGSPAGPAGMEGNIECLQAALHQELQHVMILQNLGAQSPYKTFYFPAMAITKLGYTSHAGTFLWMLDHLETACIGAYMQRIGRYATLQHPDLALLAARTLGVEAEHRALYRVIAEDYPANNVTLEVAQFTCANDIQRVLDPYLTGKGLPGRAHRVVALPTQAQIKRVLAKMM
jgi:Ferritin-like domain